MNPPTADRQGEQMARDAIANIREGATSIDLARAVLDAINYDALLAELEQARRDVASLNELVRDLWALPIGIRRTPIVARVAAALAEEGEGQDASNRP